MTQTFMRFLHFRRTKSYMQYLHSNNTQQQKSSNACLEVTESDFFALDSENGRIYALCNLLGLVGFWDEQRKKAESAEGLARALAELVESGEELADESGEELAEESGEESEN